MGAGETDQAEAIRSVTIGANAELLVNGQPFFPIMLWAQSPASFERGLALGVNTFVGSRSLPAPDYLDALWRRGLYGVVHFHPEAIDHPALLGWLHPDEPDMYPAGDETAVRREPAAVIDHYRHIRSLDATRPVWLNLTAHFSRHYDYSRFTSDAQRRIYYDYVTAAEVVGFDNYPIYQRNRPDRLTWVADGVSDLREFAGPGRALFAWIETNQGSRWIEPALQREPTPEEVRCEIWMALVRGVQAIGYFPHSWIPDYREFAIPPENVAALATINRQIAELATVLLGPPAPDPVAIDADHGLHLEAVAKADGDGIVIIVINMDMERRAGGFVLHCSRLQAGLAVTVDAVLGSRRSLTAEASRLHDCIDPLGVNIYHIPA